MKNSRTFKVFQAGEIDKPFSCTMARISKVEAFCDSSKLKFINVLPK